MAIGIVVVSEEKSRRQAVEESDALGAECVVDRSFDLRGTHLSGTLRMSCFASSYDLAMSFFSTTSQLGICECRMNAS